MPAIAAAAHVKPRAAYRLAAEPETQFLIRELMRPHHAKLKRMTQKAITAVNSALVAKEGRKACHETRLHAVDRYCDLMHLAEGQKPPDAEDIGLVTWEQFVVLYQRRTEA